jgi:hypothetical protein
MAEVEWRVALRVVSNVPIRRALSGLLGTALSHVSDGHLLSHARDGAADLSHQKMTAHQSAHQIKMNHEIRCGRILPCSAPMKAKSGVL